MRSLSRKTAYRKSTLRNLATSLILFERITTTTAKAKELKPVVEHLINSARPGDLNGRRKLLAYLFDENAVKKTIDELLPRYANTPSGFIKTYRKGPRLGDAADMTIIELQKANVLKEENANKETVVESIDKPKRKSSK
ncbi:MAG: 50S ribosomal protein L17 [Candidatus Berkelbacteria bacterium]